MDDAIPAVTALTSSDLALVERVREALVAAGVQPPGWRDRDAEGRQRFQDEVRAVLIGLDPRDPDLAGQAQRVSAALSGLGVLDPLLCDPSVEEIFVRGGQVAVERDGRFVLLGQLAEDRYFEDLVRLAADQGGAAVRADRPAVLVDLPGGERLTAILPRLSLEGTAVNIRTFGRRVRTLPEMAASGSFAPARGEPALPAATHPALAGLSEAPARFLAWLASELAGSLLIAGEMGSGKTTLLNALSAFLPRTAPVAALETFRELELQHPFLLRAAAPSALAPGEAGVTLDWVLNVIYTRMNPAVILLGEIVSAEALPFLQAATLGRRAFATIHGGTVEEALMRLEQLALAQAPALGLPAVRAMAASGIHAVALMARRGPARVLRRLAVVEGLDPAGGYRLRTLFAGGDGSDRQDLARAYRALEGAA